MSNFARNGENSNSAICVSVYKSDYGATPEAAIEFQRSLERAAFAAGGGDFFAPASTAGDFLRGTCGAAHGRVHPTYMGGRTRPANLRALFPAALSDALADGCAHSEKNCRGLTRRRAAHRRGNAHQRAGADPAHRRAYHVLDRRYLPGR